MAATIPDDPNSIREPSGYICPKCREVTWQEYKPYCGSCGAQMPSKTMLQLTGLATYPWDYGSPVRDIETIAAILANVGTTTYRLHEFRPSFQATEIRFSETDGDRETHALICVWTKRLNIPIDQPRWRGELTLSGNQDDGFRLFDNVNDAEISAGSILLYAVGPSLRSAW